MTLLTANDLPILAATIQMPRRGVWHAIVSVQAEEIDGLTETIDLVLGDTTLTGFARRAGLRHGRAELLVVGGAGGLEAVLEGRYYVDAQARLPLGDILREAGETLSSDVSSDVTDVTLARWTRRRGRAGIALSDLATTLDVVWRVLSDGTVWLGEEAWPEVEIEHDVLDEAPAHDQAELAVDDPSLAPGTVLLGRQISYVQHVISPEQIRSRVWYERGTRTGGAFIDGTPA